MLTTELASDVYAGLDDIQAANLIQMENLDYPSSGITQSATPSADVRLLQDSGSSHQLQAVNTLLTGDSGSDVSLIQTFNADTVGVEMIQNNASYSWQAINYIGIR